MTNNKTITVHFVPRNTETIGSSRLRVYAPASRLAKMGVECRMYRPPTLYNKYQFSISRIKEFIFHFFMLLKIGFRKDILFGQKIHSQPEFAYLAIFMKKLMGFRFIFDFDDAIFDRPMFRTKSLIKTADTVIAGGHYLAQYAKQYNPRVELVPTSYDPAIYDITKYKKEGSGGKTNIGWIGFGPNHRENLKLVVEPLRVLARKYPLRFICIGVLGDKDIKDMFSGIDNLEFLPVDRIDWVDETIAAGHIYSFDIGIMPLADTVRSRGSCGGKAIQYMAMGIATVASPVGEITYLIEDGVNGYLATGFDEWTTRLETLISDKNLRVKLGANARKTVLENYNIDINILKIYDIITQLSGNK